ncbi:hypothetical protein [Gimesia panareensis]|uniref:hypothetical protein n=1 Tax=Gimesia panareensis TaxID=2527978 RepID=UPI00119E15FA|nr:hypothetical protein [Gimesia panareensis]
MAIKGLSAQIHQVNTGVLPVQPDAAGFHYWTSIMSSQEISFKNETESSPVLHEKSDSTRQPVLVCRRHSIHNRNGARQEIDSY